MTSIEGRTALNSSEDRLIGSETPYGFATVFEHAGGSAERYLLRFIPRYCDGFNTAGTVTFESYRSDSAATASTDN